MSNVNYDTGTELLGREALRAFGRHLAVLRKKQHWSQERLALESGIARSYLGGVERGQRNLSFKNLVRLALTLQISLPDLLNFDSGSIHIDGVDFRLPSGATHYPLPITLKNSATGRPRLTSQSPAGSGSARVHEPDAETGSGTTPVNKKNQKNRETGESAAGRKKKRPAE